MQNSLFKKFDYYWVFVILTVILSYGFFLTNSSMGIDDNILNIFGNKLVIISSYRLGDLFFSNNIIPCEYLPFWREFLGVFFYVLGVTIHAENFIKYINFDKKLATIFTCLVISFPYIAFHFIFLQKAIQLGLIMISTAYAVRYFYNFFTQKKSKSNFILMFISLLFAASLYESAVYYFVISCLIIEFFKFLFDKNEKFYNRIFCIYSFSFCSIILNILLCEILKKIMHIKYSKFDDFFMYEISCFSNFFKSFIEIQKDFFSRYITTCEYNFGSVIALISIVLLLIFTLIQTFKTKNFNILFCAICIILLPFTSLLLLGNAYMPFRAYTTLSFLVAMVFVLLFYLCKEKQVLNKIIIGFISFIVILNTQELNQIFYSEHIKVENDKQFAYSIMHDLHKLGFEHKPIIWIGVRDNPKLRYNYIESEEINISSFNWDRYSSFKQEVHIRRTYAFLEELGMDIKSYYDLDIFSKEKNDIFMKELKQAAKEMPIYPKPGSIKENGDYVIIKIGNSKVNEDEMDGWKDKIQNM